MQCKDCGNEAEARTSKENKVYYVCTTCPGKGDYPSKFLCYLEGMEAYKKPAKSAKKVPTKSIRVKPYEKPQKDIDDNLEEIKTFLRAINGKLDYLINHSDSESESVDENDK